jgi:hypothetical protein
MVEWEGRRDGLKREVCVWGIVLFAIAIVRSPQAGNLYLLGDRSYSDIDNKNHSANGKSVVSSATQGNAVPAISTDRSGAEGVNILGHCAGSDVLLWMGAASGVRIAVSRTV